MVRKKILYIYHTSSIGGGSYCLYRIIDKLDKQKYQPIVLLKDEGSLCKMLENIGAEIIFLGRISTVPYNESLFNVTSIKNILNILLSIPKLIKHLKKVQPDIVYINTMMMYPYLMVAKSLKFKTIIHIREHWPQKSHRNQFNFAKRNIRKYADRIIAINNTSASMMNIPEKTTIVYDWIDFTQRDGSFSFDQLFGKNSNSLRIFTFTGGVDPIKGSLEVVNTFSSKITDANARLLMLGADTTLNYSGFRGKLAHYLSVFKYDTYWNKVKKNIMNDSRIVCLPSTYDIKQIIEKSYCIISFFTIPHANLILAESVYLGQIALAASTPEAIEYSNGGQSALLFRMNDLTDFSEKISDLILNYDYYKGKAQAGITYNKHLFDPTRNSDILNRVYEDLILK